MFVETSLIFKTLVILSAQLGIVLMMCVFIALIEQKKHMQITQLLWDCYLGAQST